MSGLLRSLSHLAFIRFNVFRGDSIVTRSLGILSQPRRGIEDLWKGGYLDPLISARQKEEFAKTGDAWPACLLRLKSYEDLQNLWFICLKEKNLLIGERWAAWQQGADMKFPERLKKLKLTMKRILTVITRREIHQQCTRAKSILSLQKEREELETRLFHLQEQKLQLTYKIKNLGADGGLAQVSWYKTLKRIETSINEIENEIQPLRKETMQFLIPDWHYEKKYSDLPGRITWKKQYIPALEGKFKKKPIRWY